MRQLRLVKVTVNITKILIAVKFPCSLKVHLRSDQQSITTSGLCLLKDGQCQINEKLQIEIEAVYDTEMRCYNQISVVLATTICSTNSNIPGGNTTFNPFAREQGIDTQVVESLQKCSDREAKIYFSHSWRELKKIRDLDNDNMKSSKALLNLNRSVLSKNSSFKRLQQKQQVMRSQSKEKDHVNLMSESRVRAYNNLPSKYGTQTNQQAARQRIRTNATYNNYNNQTNQRRQNALKSQVQMLNLEIQKYKQKCRHFQRKQRELNMTIKDLKDNIEKKKTKVFESESHKSQIQLQLSEKQKQLKQSRLENKKLQEKLEDAKMAISNMEKKIDIKEKTFDQEIRLYTDKISQIQKDINKKTFDYNSLLQKMETTEKNNQLNMKEKEKKHVEEKTQLMKKIELLTQDIQKLKQMNDEKELKFNNLSVTHKSLMTQQATVKNELHRLEANYEVLKAEFANEKNQRLALEREIESLSAAESDKNIFKKKYNETFQQLSKTNEKHDRLQSSHNQLLLKFNESEEKLKEATKGNKQLITQNGQLSTEVDTLKKQNNTLSAEFNSLSAKNQMLTQKLNDTKSKLDAQKQQYESMQTHYEDKVNYLLKTKEYVESQVQDWKQKYDKQQIILKQLENKNKNVNDQLLSRHEEYLKLQQSNHKSLQNIQQLKKRIDHLQQQIQAAQKKQKNMQDSLKSKGNDAYQLQKKLNQQQQQIYILQQKVQSQAKQFNEKLHQFQKTIHQKDKLINENQNFIAQLKNQLANTKQQHEKTLNQLNKKKKDLVAAQDTIKEHLEILADNQKRIQDLNTQLELTNLKVATLEEELDRTIKRVSELQESNNSIEEKWVQYQQTTSKALEQLLDQIALDQPATKIQLLKFPDNSLSNMQINALKNRNQLIAKYKLTVSSLQQQIELYKKELEKVKALDLSKQAQLDQEILNLKTKQSQLHEEWMAEKSQLNKAVHTLEEEKQQLLSESQKLKSTISHLEEINSELNEEKLALEQQIDQREQDISLLNDQILQLKSQQIKEKNNNEYSLRDYKEQTNAQIQKIKQTLTETCERLLAEQKQKQAKQDRISDLEKKHEQVSLELVREANKKSQIESKLKEFQKQKEQLRTSVNNRDKEIENLHNELESRNLQIQGLLQKQSMLQTERKQTYQSLTETEVMKEKLQKALELEKDNSSNLKAQLKDLLNVSTSTNQQASKKIKQQKDTITKHESEIQLKCYVIKQLQNLRAQNQTEIKELNKQLQSKKQVIFEANQQIESLKNKVLKISQNQSATSTELQTLQDQNSSNLQKITQLENHIAQLSPKAQQLIVRLEEITQMNKKVNSLEDELHRTALQLQATQNQLKNAISKMGSKEQEYRKKIIALQTKIAQNIMQFKDSQTKSSSEWEREKANLIKQLEEQDKLMRDQQQQSKFRIDQLQNQIESLNQDCLQLSNLLNEKEEEILELEQQNQNNERKISQLNGQLKSCLEAWDKQKAASLPSRKQMNDLQSQMGKFQDYANQLDTKTKQLLQISRKKGSEESKFGVTELLRELSSTLSKSKLKILNKVESEDQKDMIINEYKQLQDKIDLAMRSQNSIYK